MKLLHLSHKFKSHFSVQSQGLPQQVALNVEISTDSMEVSDSESFLNNKFYRRMIFFYIFYIFFIWARKFKMEMLAEIPEKSISNIAMQ